MPHIEISNPIILVIWVSYLLTTLVNLAELYFGKNALAATIVSRTGKHRSAGRLLRALAKKHQFSAVFIGRKEATYQESTAFFRYSENSVNLLGDYYNNTDAQKTFIIFHEFGHVLSQHYLWKLIEQPCRYYFLYITKTGNSKLFFPFFIIAGWFSMPILPMFILLTVISIPVLIVFIDEFIASTLGTIAMYRHCNLTGKQLLTSTAFYTYAFSTYVQAINKVYKSGFMIYVAILISKQLYQLI